MHRLGLHRVDGSGKGEEFILMYVRAIRKLQLQHTNQILYFRKINAAVAILIVSLMVLRLSRPVNVVVSHLSASLILAMRPFSTQLVLFPMALYNRLAVPIRYSSTLIIYKCTKAWGV